MSRLACFISPSKSMDQAIERVRLAEYLGYESVWVIQIAGRDATLVASAYASATSKIGIGTGVLPVYPRSPVVMAQTAATLDEMSGGRFILGLGTSHKITIEMWHGMELSKPIATMREYVGAVRSILQGQPYMGTIYRTMFNFGSYEPTRRDLPIYISCLSPQMCRLAGEVADGAVLWMCAPGYIRDVIVPNIAKGRAKAGKPMEGFEIVAAVPAGLTDNVAAGRDAFRKVAVTYWNLPFYRAAIEGGGFEADLERFDRSGPEGISEETIDRFAGIGTFEDGRRIIEDYRSAGVTLPTISPLPSHAGSAPIEVSIEALSKA